MPAVPALRLGELVATFALAQDNAFGQPLESQLRSCLLATWMADEAGFDTGLKETIYWAALLRYLGCTGHAHEVAAYLGDEIAARARTLVHDAANPAEVASDVIALASAAHPDQDPEQVARAVMATIHEWAVSNFGAGCEVADLLAQRLGFSGAVREALACTFERWNGMGVPRGVAGEDIPLAIRVVHVSHDMEAIARRVSPGDAVAAVVERRDRTYDPALADLFAAHGAGWLERLAKLDPWDAVLDLEPVPGRLLSGEVLDEALVVVADFVDLKSPYLGGFSRRCADLVYGAARHAGLDSDDAMLLRRAAWVHDIGLTGVPNTILDKPAPLTRAENDRFEVHTLLTEQVLRRTPALSVLNPVACAHHEHADGSGSPRRGSRRSTSTRGLPQPRGRESSPGPSSPPERRHESPMCLTGPADTCTPVARDAAGRPCGCVRRSWPSRVSRRTAVPAGSLRTPATADWGCPRVRR